jgi:uncharacterized YccA/Bax inhibitor family protein
MASNPVFNRIDKQITQGGYAGFNEQPSASRRTGGPGYQDGLSSGQIEDIYNQPSAGPVQTGRITLDDVVMKTLGLFTIVVAVGALTWWFVASPDPERQALASPLMLGGMLGGLAVGLVIAFKKTISVPLIVLYAVLEGVLVGAISQVFETIYPGIVSTAVIATVCTFAGMFVGWKVGLIRVTDRSRRIFGMALIGYLLFGLVNLVFAMVTNTPFGIGGNGLLGIGISVLGVGLASYSLAIDFDSVDRAVAAGLPEKYSWLMAHGLIVSLVWLYLEILRLLARLRQ